MKNIGHLKGHVVLSAFDGRVYVKMGSFPACLVSGSTYIDTLLGVQSMRHT